MRKPRLFSSTGASLTLALAILLPRPAGGQEFSKENLQKTLVSITTRAKQAEEAAAAAEAASMEAERARVAALGKVAEIANANTRLEAELTARQGDIAALGQERDSAIDERDAARLAEQKQKARAEKWTKWCVITWGLLVLFYGGRWLIRSVLPI